jgi:hypothetical protein
MSAKRAFPQNTAALGKDGMEILSFAHVARKHLARLQSGQLGQMSIAALAEEQQAAQQQQMAHIARAQLFLGQQQQQHSGPQVSFPCQGIGLSV